MYIRRHVEGVIKRSFGTYPAVLVTGPRQVGKSTVLKNMYPDVEYETLDDVNTIRAISSDPTGYLRLKGTPFLIDEVQKIPDLFGSLKYVIDKEKSDGMYLLTGSQKFALMKGVSESLSGRISVIDLLGLSFREINGDGFDKPFLPTQEYLQIRKPITSRNVSDVWKIIHKGSMPALYEDSERDWEKYYSDYVNTYIERDVFSLLQIGDRLTFMQFMVSLAGRTGELLNMDSLAKDIGVSSPTVKRWLSVLQASNVVYLLQPFSLNTTKRVVKTPKVYFTDTGLVCYLCRWLTTETLINGAQAGSIFETYVVSEIIKSYYNSGKTPNLYFFRNGDGQEVDLVFYENGKIYPVEIKKTASPSIKDINGFKVLYSYYPTVEVSEGGIICNAESILPLGQGNKIIPINYI
ncbi:MAG: ATP-binding protein [Clostridia bacterium]|nr:ATP-binding protein [Clostridia bacterium]